MIPAFYSFCKQCIHTHHIQLIIFIILLRKRASEPRENKASGSKRAKPNFCVSIIHLLFLDQAEDSHDRYLYLFLLTTRIEGCA